MTAFSVQTPYPPFADADGAPLENGYIWLGSAGLDPQSNPVTAYFDAALTIAAAQPIRTQGGYPVYQGTPARIYINGTNYSIRVMNKNGLTVYTALNTTEAWNGSVLADNSVTTAKLAPNAVTAAKVERVAANQVLRSTGVSTDPAWGSLNLTTDVTGVLPVANGGTGQATAAAGFDALKQAATDSYTGVVELATTAEIQAGTDTTRAITPAGLRGGALVLGTPQIPSGVNSIKFTGIPSWIKRVTILFDRVSSNGTELLTVKIFTAASAAASIYRSGAMNGSSSGINFETSFAHFILEPTNAAGASVERSGSMVLETLDGNLWSARSILYADTKGIVSTSAGRAYLSAALGEIEIAWTGSDQFDAGGAINILYE